MHKINKLELRYHTLGRFRTMGHCTSNLLFNTMTNIIEANILKYIDIIANIHFLVVLFNQK